MLTAPDEVPHELRAKREISPNERARAGSSSTPVMNALDLQQYRALVEHAPAMIWRAAPDAKHDYFNASWLAFTGRALHQELGIGWTEGVHPDDVDRCRARYLDCFARHERFEVEFRLRRHDGAYRHVIDHGAPYEAADGSFAGFVGSCMDVDDRRGGAASEAVELFEMSLDNLCVVGFDGYFKRVSPSWTRTLGWTSDELMSRPTIELVHPEDRHSVLAARKHLTDGIPLLTLVNRYRCKDGTYRWLEWRSVSHVGRRLVYAAARDVTEQVGAQQALRELTESLTTTLHSIADGVIATDADGAVARMNPVAEKLTGWTSADAVGNPLHLVFHVVDEVTRGAAALPQKRTLEEGIAVDLASHTLLVARDGTELPIASSCAPMRSADGSVSGTVLVFRDMTAERNAKEAHERMQRQLIFADRMASVGTLAAGVAHEINNPLAYMIANLDMLVEEIGGLPSGPVSAQLAEWAEMVIEAREGTERIRKIVRGLQTFSRAEEERRTVVDVRPVLDLSINLASNEMRHRARLVKDYGAIPLVVADGARLGQTFVNLLVNAAQAIPEGFAEANEICVATSTDAVGRAVIEIRDTGPGIPVGVIGRVFDPFFTTKPIGVGTGLGLSVCHNIVTSLGGEITARNQKGRGAIFRVVLPAASGSLGETPGAAAEKGAAKSRRAAVLIVDDDRAVGAALGRVLRGHDVTVVTSGKEALALLRSGKPFDVVLSDLMMPEMSGMDLYDELALSSPQAAKRMIFVTGGAFTPAANAFLDRVPNQRLLKPFDAAAVRRLVEESVS